MSRLNTVCAIAAVILLAGCGGQKGNVLGFDRSGPDEFSVVRHPPLSIPPNATLRPPRQGTSEAERDRGTDAARASLVSAPDGTAVGSGPRPSPGEVALVTRAGAYYGIEPDIKQVVDEESTRLVREGDDFVNRVRKSVV